MKLKDVLKPLKELAPENTAQSWDNVGLQIGDPNAEISKVLLSLDITGEVIDEAVSKECQLIISHHPLIFNPLKAISGSDFISRLITKAIKADLAIYCSHTNLDLAEGGVNTSLGEKFGFNKERTKGLVPSGYQEFCKVVVYVPPEDAEKTKKAFWDSGAGFIGEYDHCLYEIEGIGQFRPLKDANPYKGEKGRDARVRELRLETVVSFKGHRSLIEAVKQVHPYEEPVIDIYPLQYPKSSSYLGRIYTLEKPVIVDLLQNRWGKKTLFYGNREKPIRKVAVLGGSGSLGLEYAFKSKADLYITGELDYHLLIEANEEGLGVLLLGHGASEAPVLEALQKIVPIESVIAENPFLKTL